MKAGLTKQQKITDIYFDEKSPIICVHTDNKDLKNRLTVYAGMYPEHCNLTDDDEQGGLTFEIEKGRFPFRLTAPYSEERCKEAREMANISLRSGRKVISDSASKLQTGS